MIDVSKSQKPKETSLIFDLHVLFALWVHP
jgi:hypothetical protein